MPGWIGCDICGKVFGKRLQSLRLKSGLSQQAFAEKVGLSEHYINLLENDLLEEKEKGHLTLSRMNYILNTLDVTFSEFFEGFEVEVAEESKRSTDSNKTL